MPQHNGPGGPGVFIPPPPPPPPIALYVPASVLEILSPEQQAKIAQIEVEFAQRVSNVLSKSYNEILAVIRGGETQID